MAALVNNSVKAFSVTPGTTLETASFAIGGSNRILYVAVPSGDGTPVIPSSVKWGGSGGTSLTQISSTLDVSVYGKHTLWRLIAPTATTSTVYVTWPSSQGERLVIAVAVEDADQTTPNGTVATATGTDTAPTVNATTVSGDLVLDFAFQLDTGGQNIAFTDDVPDVIEHLFDAGMLYESAASSKETATGTSTTTSWTLNHTPTAWGIFAFAVNAAGGGGGGSGGPTIQNQLKRSYRPRPFAPGFAR